MIPRREGKSAQYVVVLRPKTPPGFSPYRLVGVGGQEVAEINEFLDAQAARGLSDRSVRAYAYGLLNFWRWMSQALRRLCELQEVDLLDFIRFQRAQAGDGEKEVAPKTINLRLTAARCLYRFHCGRDLPAGGRGFYRRSNPYHSAVASAEGYLHPSQPRALQLRVRTPRRVVQPLSPEEVRCFLEHFRTWRDLSIAALMLLCGLRSREVIGVTLSDLSVSEGKLRIRGKGDKERVVPLAPQVISLLQSYMEVERPPVATGSVFVVLKGPRRGEPMTASGVRSLFRYHRVAAKVPRANPHRFRHTFGSDMARAGISLPALMKLMGHADIHTTMIYVELTPKDVWDEFQRIVRILREEKISPRGS